MRIELQILTMYSIYHDVHWFSMKIFRKDLRDGIPAWIDELDQGRKAKVRSCPIEIFITLLPSGFSLTGSK